MITKEAVVADQDSTSFAGRVRPPWLLDKSDSKCWYFRQDVPGYSPSHYTVNWEFSECIGNAQAVHLEYWRTIAQAAVIAYGESKKRGKRVTSIIGFARSVRSFAAWACDERRCSSLAMIDADDVRAYEEHIARLEIGASAVAGRLSVLRIMWQLRDEIGEQIGYCAYRWRGELKRVAKRLGKRDGRTPTLPPKELFVLLDHCLKLVESGEEWIGLMERHVEIRHRKRRFHREMAAVGVSSAEVLRQARTLYGACVVIVFTLFGSRKHEIAKITFEDVRRLLQTDSHELKGAVTKSSNGAGGTTTVRPTIPELENALKQIVRLVGGDIERDVGPLFRPLILDAARQLPTKVGLDTGQIYRLISRVVNDAGIDIVIRPHMFRRAFSMIYVWRYEFGDLAYLSRFLYHSDLRHTLAYVVGDDVNQFMSDAERALAGSVMERALLGQERFGGGFGARLERVARRLRASTTVLRPDQVDDWLMSRIGDGKYSLRAAPHGYCVILGDRGGRGACSTDGRTPNFANRTDEHCSACGNFLAPERSLPYWQERYVVHRKVLEITKIDVLKKVAREAVAGAKRVIDSVLGRRGG